MFYLFKVRYYLDNFGFFKGCVNKFQNLAKKHNISRRDFTKIHNKLTNKRKSRRKKCKGKKKINAR